jgi:uncharacterized protein
MLIAEQRLNSSSLLHFISTIGRRGVRSQRFVREYCQHARLETFRIVEDSVACQYSVNMHSEDQENAEQNPDRVFLSAALFELALAALALFLGWAIGPSARETVPDLVVDELWPIFSSILLGCVAAGPILLFVEIIRRIPWEPIRELERLTDDGMLRTLLQLRPPELIMVSLCAGIGEELLFRGWLMYWIADLIGLADFSGGAEGPLAIGIALVMSSFVFGLFHPITKLYVVIAAVMGIYFGGLVLYTGNLLVPIAAHATYDAVQLILTARNERREATQTA